MSKIQKRISYLEENGYIPTGIDYKTRCNILNVRALNYDYWGYAYADGEEHHNNSFISIQIKHSMVEKPFWINIFKGAQRKDNDVSLIIATKDAQISDKDSLLCEDGALYDSYGIEDSIDGYETIQELVTAFKYLYFEEDVSGSYDNGDGPLLYSDGNIVYDIANEISLIGNVSIRAFESIDNPNLENVKDVGDKYLLLAKGRLLYVSVISDNVIQEIKINLLKDDAEVLFLRQANKWLDFDGIFEKVEDVNKYLLENENNRCIVSMDLM